MEEGARSVDDQDRCLYVGTPWEAKVVTDRGDLEAFKEAPRTIRSVLLVRALSDLHRFLLRVFGSHEVQLSVLFVASLSLSERRLRQAFCARRRTRMPRPPQPMRRSCRL
jgi:hypothetical protein